MDQGSSVSGELNVPPETEENDRKRGHSASTARTLQAETAEWVATLSILRNRVVVNQLGLVFVIPLFVLGLILALIIRPSGPEEWGFLGRIVLMTAAVFLGLLLIAVLLVYGGRYEYEFRMDGKGIGCRPHGRTAKKNRVINFLLIFSGNPTAMGSGMLAQARQVEYVAWRDVDTVIADERRRTITLQRGRRPLMVAPCDEQHYVMVLQAAQEAAAKTRSRLARTRAARARAERNHAGRKKDSKG